MKSKNSDRTKTALGQSLADFGLLQEPAEGLHRRPVPAKARDREVILLVLVGQETKVAPGGNGGDGEAPVGPSLSHSRRHGIVRPGLGQVAGRAGSAKQAVDQ